MLQKIILLLVLFSLPLLSCDDSQSAVCANVSCSDHGHCVEDDNGDPTCDCDDGFEAAGLTCVEHFTIESEVITDNLHGLMFTRTPVDHLERPAAITACENATVGGYDDWTLPDSATLGPFHRDMNAAGIVPEQLFAFCLAEVTSDGYVRTKKGAEDYGGEPGDTFGFTGAANARCVRALP